MRGGVWAGQRWFISYWWLANLDATFTEGKNCQLIQGGVHSSSYWSWLEYNILYKECSRENSQRLKGTPMRFLYNVSFTGMQSVTLIMEIGRSCNAYHIMVHAVLWGVWIIKSARGTAKWRSYERITCLQKPFKFATHSCSAAGVSCDCNVLNFCMDPFGQLVGSRVRTVFESQFNLQVSAALGFVGLWKLGLHCTAPRTQLNASINLFKIHVVPWNLHHKTSCSILSRYWPPGSQDIYTELGFGT